ncbi:ATP-binding protein [Nocardia neocaledoniensis]|uniref:ATP-binding protein n=1 Tax=Nocardia neocaledoniensis TaxID=236511 RepID=UPI0024545AB3|nr:ATP-binding protein [Nocardia neocaledoniensis]
MDFVGRWRELSTLNDALSGVRDAVGTSKPGRCLILRGRRRIGKSALIEEFVQRSGAPNVFYTSEIGVGTDPLNEFADVVAHSTLPDAEIFAEALPANWTAAFRQLASVLPDDVPSVVVLDELPYLMDESGAFESVLQRAWDRELCRKPVLLILIGSDLAMMQALTAYGRPFHQRGSEMRLGPLNPADVAAMTGLEAAAAFDATLITGGLPIICARWRAGEDMCAFLARELADPVSPLIVSAQLSLAAEFPEQTLARQVLSAIGSGERTFTNIARAAGGLAHTSLTRALNVLVDKGIVAAELPIGLSPSKDRRYRITDSYLRFWLTFLGPHLSELDRMRSDLTLARIREGWTSWRGRAVEPLIRDSLARLLPAHGVPAVPAIGGYWTRTNDVEIDIVGADREPVAKELAFLGSVKWLENSPFDSHDLTALQKHRFRLTDAQVPLIAVTRSGASTDRLDAVFTPVDLLAAWRAPGDPTPTAPPTRGRSGDQP